LDSKHLEIIQIKCKTYFYFSRWTRSHQKIKIACILIWWAVSMSNRIRSKLKILISICRLVIRISFSSCSSKLLFQSRSITAFKSLIRLDSLSNNISSFRMNKGKFKICFINFNFRMFQKKHEEILK
jgi:hypothetical protein